MECLDGIVLVVCFEKEGVTDDVVSVGNDAGVLDGTGVDGCDAMIDDGGGNFRD